MKHRSLCGIWCGTTLRRRWDIRSSKGGKNVVVVGSECEAYRRKVEA